MLGPTIATQPPVAVNAQETNVVSSVGPTQGASNDIPSPPGGATVIGNVPITPPGIPRFRASRRLLSIETCKVTVPPVMAVTKIPVSRAAPGYRVFVVPSSDVPARKLPGAGTREKGNVFVTVRAFVPELI